MTSAFIEESRPVDTAARLYFVDNLRIALIVLVVLHHVAMAYGAGGLAFYYVELHPSGFSRSLLIFVLGNQAWFMGAFFLISGYFTPRSLDHKGSGMFLRDRAIRLGIPLIVYVLVFNPLAMFGSFFLPDYLTSLTWEDYHYLDYVRMGPMWFVVLLFFFSLAYVLWRAVSGSSPASARPNSGPVYIGAAVFVLVLAGVSFLVRRQIPVGKEEWGFPSLAYLPQYASMFAVGVVAYRKNWFRTVSVAKGLVGLLMAATATVLLFPLAFSGKMFSLELTESLGKAFGDGYWQSAVYALWDSTLVVGLSLGLIVVFRAVLDSQGTMRSFLARHSYAVYVVHIPVVVLVAVLLRSVEMEHLLKVVLAALIAVPGSFLVAYVIRKLPFASRVL